MKNYFRAVLVCAALAYPALAQDLPLHFEMNSKILTPPPGMQTIGDSHGDIAVSPAGEIYVSVQAGTHPGIQVYGADGRYLRNVPDAPTDLQPFVSVERRPGLLLLWESYLRHEVTPNSAKAERISLSFNYG